MRVSIIKVSLISLVTPLFITGALSAQSRKVPLELGMNQYQVLSNWGAPIDKSERESARTEVWSYQSGDVVFHEGVVIKAPMIYNNPEVDTSQKRSDLKPKLAPTPTSIPVKPPTRELNSAERDTVMMEVLRSVPSEPDNPAAAGAPKAVERNIPE